MRLTNTDDKKVNLYLTLTGSEAFDVHEFLLDRYQSCLEIHQQPINKVIKEKLNEVCDIHLKHINYWEYSAQPLECYKLGKISNEGEHIIFIQTTECVLFKVEQNNRWTQEISFIEHIDEINPKDHIIGILPDPDPREIKHLYINKSKSCAYAYSNKQILGGIIRRVECTKLIDEIFRGTYRGIGELKGEAQIKEIIKTLIPMADEVYTPYTEKFIKHICQYEFKQKEIMSYDVAIHYEDEELDDDAELSPRVLQILKELDQEIFPYLNSSIRWWLKLVVTNRDFGNDDFNPYAYNRLLKEQYRATWGDLHDAIVQSVQNDDMKAFLRYCKEIDQTDILLQIIKNVDEEVVPACSEVRVLMKKMIETGECGTSLTPEEKTKYVLQLEEEVTAFKEDRYEISSFSKWWAESLCEDLSNFCDWEDEEKIEEYLRCANYYYKYIDTSLRYFGNFPMKESELSEPFELEEGMIQLVRSFRLEERSEFIGQYLRSVSDQKKTKFKMIK